MAKTQKELLVESLKLRSKQIKEMKDKALTSEGMEILFNPCPLCEANLHCIDCIAGSWNRLDLCHDYAMRLARMSTLKDRQNMLAWLRRQIRKHES